MDKQKAVRDAEEVKTPAVESPTTEVQEAQTPSEIESVPAEKLEQTPEVKDESNELPQEQSEQAQAFAKMRHRIKELEEQVGERQHKQSVFEQLKPSYSPQDIQQAQSQIDINNYIDKDTGMFQAEAYNRDINEKVREAQRIAQYTATQATSQMIDEFRAKEKFPELDVNSERYNSDFEKRVAAQYFFDLYQGKQPSITKIASEEAKVFFKDTNKVKEEATQKIKEELTEKEQASLSASGRFQPGEVSAEELAELVQRSRRGDNWAIAERLRKIRGAK